ncbi:DNA-binding MarR family transcriptional regulator [Variovorax boronicumulans]|uniref:DNA-binding MarR family transcriptional regulator n=1 Tax=Variovorax boronicumulans TaxID=436515 RepID=A0AAW8CKM6_9BURK|nr:MarR family transcriptional regulator [Variovorax boronicumulans]MDP9891913.1 DNA-binding MarR family transcriptional regulator [Variovorax boronicumulans]MDP9991866.1 DNA-binding MarR family transcriptional regulator [Variovorax boronicumulans]MDQ0003894.1 DNA-binding MarR family transcriptional regulator [Variovorax boronicumulans]MDQ0041047.1 DNA-binding MarR family transcriptional regulator [Variovorax boronicumulans]MDQ0053086.1 DNA-binding MarR family transcriptional regulator [Variov
MPAAATVDAAAPRRPLDDLLLYRMSRLLSVAGSMVIRLCEGRFGITRREWRLIAVLASRGELSSSQLAEHAQLDRARTSKAVGSLVAKQLISRVAKAGDRRQVQLGLTEAGQALYDALFPLVTKINGDLMKALDADDAARFDASLNLLQAKAERMVQEAVLPKADRGRRGASSSSPSSSRSP